MITLISPGFFIAADRAGSLDEAIGQEAIAGGTVQLFDLMFHDIPALIDLPENSLDDLRLSGSRGSTEIVEPDIEPPVDVAMDDKIMVA